MRSTVVGEAHLPTRRCWERANWEIGEGGSGVRATAFPAADDIVVFGNEIGCTHPSLWPSDHIGVWADLEVGG
jgi:hypothetical protein